jgi:type II secretory pathway component PulJ
MKTAIFFMIVVMCSSLLTAQTTQQANQVQRVDQAVGDLDGLSRSIRQQGAGLRYDGEHTSLYSIPEEKLQEFQVFGQAAPTTGVQRKAAYLRVAPGITSQSDQTYYVVRSNTKESGVDSNVASSQDGAFIEVIPANTVFILSPQVTDMARGADQASQASTAFADNALKPQRVDNRVSNQMVSRRVDNRYEAQRVDNRVSSMPNQSLRYRVNEPMHKTRPQTEVE